MFTLEYLSGLGQPAAPVHLAPGLHELLDEGRVGHIASVNAAHAVRGLVKPLQLPITHALEAGAELLDLVQRHRRVDPRFHCIARVSKPGSG
jgi:hypothetical protein